MGMGGIGNDYASFFARDGRDSFKLKKNTEKCKK